MKKYSNFGHFRFSRATWSVLALAVGLVILSAANLVYRFTLPTDGWAVRVSDDIENSDWVYWENLVGVPSGLQPEDVVTAVNGQSIAGLATNVTVPPPPGWAAGQRVEMRVMRQEQALSLSVPIVHWTFLALGRNFALQFEGIIGLLGGLLLFTLALATIYRRPEVPAARALLLLSAAFLILMISGLLPDGISVQFNRPAFYATRVFSNLLFILLLTPSLLVFTLLFPQPKRILQRYPWFVLAPYAAGILISILMSTNAEFLVAGLLATLGMVIGSLAGLIHSAFTQRDSISRAQLRWAGGGFFTGLALMLLVFPVNSGWIADPWLAHILGSGFHLGFTVIGVALAIAIQRYHLFDIDILINRALVYGVLTALIIAIYVFVVGYLGTIFRTENNLLISLAATGLVAVLFQPLRDRLQRGINRLMYGQRDEPVAVLSRLGARLEATLVPDEILPGLLDTVVQALKLPNAAIDLRVGDEWKVQAQSGLLAESGQAAPPFETFPLIYQGETIGQMRVSARAPGEHFNPADRLLLTNIARQAGAVARSVQLTAALQQSRQQLVTAREEERRRLRRDLHDGLGPQLASQTLTIDAINKLIERNPEKARELLEHLKTQSQAAIQDIRRLVYELRPPALDELGLVEALRTGTAQHGQAGNCVEITTDPDPLPALPAAVEVAAYRIAQEAITNAVRHAQARNCMVNLMVQNRRFDLTIADDGPGFPAEFHYGVGLNSMRERVEELGGQVRFTNPPEGGARVQVWLPLPGADE
jgi:signal transduction histidine kinase